MEPAKKLDFETARTLSMAAAVKLARVEIKGLSDAPVDSVARCEKHADGGWLVALDLVESPARMGENDLLARYELLMDSDGTVSSIERVARYRREDGNAP